MRDLISREDAANVFRNARQDLFNHREQYSPEEFNTRDLMLLNAEQMIHLLPCRSGDLLESALSWLKSFDLIFDYVNENVPEMVNKYGSDTRKIHADLYIDDKAVKPYWR